MPILDAGISCYTSLTNCSLLRIFVDLSYFLFIIMNVLPSVQKENERAELRDLKE